MNQADICSIESQGEKASSSTERTIANCTHTGIKKNLIFITEYCIRKSDGLQFKHRPGNEPYLLSLNSGKDPKHLETFLLQFPNWKSENKHTCLQNFPHKSRGLIKHSVLLSWLSRCTNIPFHLHTNLKDK